ncbi:MAG: hypothetical protein ACTHL3_03430 [Candidatus Nitrosocosmicus sp.]
MCNSLETFSAPTFTNSTSPSHTPTFSRNFYTNKSEKQLIPSTTIFLTFTFVRLFPIVNGS